MSGKARLLIACSMCMASAQRTGNGKQWLDNYQLAKKIAAELIAA